MTVKWKGFEIMTLKQLRVRGKILVKSGQALGPGMWWIEL
jgi:hypothetical protein